MNPPTIHVNPRLIRAGGLPQTQSGIGTVESILAVPLLLLIIFAGLQLTYIGMAKLHLSQALREGMRAATATLLEPKGVGAAGHSLEVSASDALDTMVSSAHVLQAFESSIEDAFSAWQNFYGEIPNSNDRRPFKWNARLYAAQLQRPNVGAVEEVQQPDHLVGHMTYWMPLKIPLFGKALSLVMPSVQQDCEKGGQTIQLCWGSGRWLWRLETRARSPLPPTDLKGSLARIVFTEPHGIDTGSESGRVFGLGDSNATVVEVSEVQMGGVSGGNPASKSLAGAGANASELITIASKTEAITLNGTSDLPQSIHSLVTEVEGRLHTTGSLSNPGADCGIQFGS